MVISVPKLQRMIDEMPGAAELGTNVVDFKKEDQIREMFHVKDPAASPELCLQVAEAMRKESGSMYCMHFL